MLEEDYSKISPLTYSLQSEPNIAYVIVRDQFGTTINQKGEMYTRQKIMQIIVPLEYFQVNVGEVEIGVKTISLITKRKPFFDTLITALLYSLLSFMISLFISKN